MIYGITLIILSLIAVPSLILAKKPDAQELLNKIAPYQGWIGVIFCIWGVWGIITAFLHIGWLTSAPIWWITLLAGSTIEAILGFMLGYSLIQKYALSKNEKAKEKGAELIIKLNKMQGKLGIIGIGVGIWMILASIMFM